MKIVTEERWLEVEKEIKLKQDYPDFTEPSKKVRNGGIKHISKKTGNMGYSHIPLY